MGWSQAATSSTTHSQRLFMCMTVRAPRPLRRSARAQLRSAGTPWAAGPKTHRRFTSEASCAAPTAEAYPGARAQSWQTSRRSHRGNGCLAASRATKPRLLRPGRAGRRVRRMDDDPHVIVQRPSACTELERARLPSCAAPGSVCRALSSSPRPSAANPRRAVAAGGAACRYCSFSANMLRHLRSAPPPCTAQRAASRPSRRPRSTSAARRRRW